MSEPDTPAMAGHFPDDGIPVLTEVVDAALLPEIDTASLETEDEGDIGGPPSLAMFPELEAERGFVPVFQPSPTSIVASLAESPAEAPHALPTEPAPNDSANWRASPSCAASLLVSVARRHRLEARLYVTRVSNLEWGETDACPRSGVRQSTG